MDRVSDILRNVKREVKYNVNIPSAECDVILSPPNVKVLSVDSIDSDRSRDVTGGSVRSLLIGLSHTSFEIGFRADVTVPAEQIL